MRRIEKSLLHHFEHYDFGDSKELGSESECRSIHISMVQDLTIRNCKNYQNLCTFNYLVAL